MFSAALIHVPFNVASSISNFLKRYTNKACAKVIGNKVNRGAGYACAVFYVCAGYGLEILCYTLSMDPSRREDEGAGGLIDWSNC